MFIYNNDYNFEWFNFIGVNISVFGSIIYSYAVFCKSIKTESKERKIILI